jgi:hypothetical protein
LADPTAKPRAGSIAAAVLEALDGNRQRPPFTSEFPGFAISRRLCRRIRMNDVTGPGGGDARDTTDLSLHFTQAWAFVDGRWLREAFQATPVQAARAS